ncbi:unnamed protein product, partial [Rotaria sordida]
MIAFKLLIVLSLLNLGRAQNWCGLFSTSQSTCNPSVCCCIQQWFRISVPYPFTETRLQLQFG